MYTAKHTFFCPDIASGFLSEEESSHAVRVLRLKENDVITLINGKGTLARAKITYANKKKLAFEVVESSNEPIRSSYIHIAIAPTKSMDRFSFFLEKAIEIGVDRITPVLCSNSERKQLNSEKLRKGAISAVKQSGHLFLPEVDNLTPLDTFLNEDHQPKQCFIAHCEEDAEKHPLKTSVDNAKKVVILIGPEGDFTNEEINLAKQNSFQSVSLGTSRLRTETAGIVACHTVNII